MYVKDIIHSNWGSNKKKDKDIYITPRKNVPRKNERSAKFCKAFYFAK